MSPAFADWTENLSEGGVFVRTDYRFSPGETLTAAVSFPGLLDPVRVAGKIAWVRTASPLTAGGIGVELEEGTPRAQLGSVLRGAQVREVTNGGKPFRLLVVDDNARLLHSYARVLDRLPSVRSAGIETIFASDGEEGLARAVERGVDLVITDVYMPKLDGFGLIERLREREATHAVPIIVITGGRSDERIRAEALAVDGFLMKPVLFAPLMDTIACLVTARGVNAET